MRVWVMVSLDVAGSLYIDVYMITKKEKDHQHLKQQ